MAFTISRNFDKITVRADEPMYIAFQDCSAAGVPFAVEGRTYALTVYVGSEIIQRFATPRKILGSSPKVVWEISGKFSGSLRDKTNVKCELAQILNDGREVIAIADVTILESSPGSLDDDAAAYAKYYQFVRRLNDPATIEAPQFEWAIKALNDLEASTPAPAPLFTTNPLISPSSGTVGQVFTATAGAASNATSFAGQWYLNGAAIGGATSLSYTSAAAGTLTYTSTATGAGGSIAATTTGATVSAAVTPAPVFTTAPTISPASGNVGQVFTATTGTASNTSSYAGQWLLDGAPISGATTLTYTSAAAGSLTYRSTATGAGGSASTTTTAATVSAAITLAALSLTPTIQIGAATTGNIVGATAGSTITGNVSGLTVNSSARTFTWSGNGSVGTVANGLVETLAGATNSPRSSAVKVAAATIPAPTQEEYAAKLFGPTGFNLGSEQLNYWGNGFPLLDRWKIAGLWYLKDGPRYQQNEAIPYGDAARKDNMRAWGDLTNKNGYPISMGGSSRIERIVNLEGPNGPAGVDQIYILETTRIDANIGVYADMLNGGTTGILTTDETGRTVRRYEFNITNKCVDFLNGNKGYGTWVYIYSLPTPFGDDDYIRMFRKDEETLLKSGEIFTPQFLSRFEIVDVLRMMDWQPTNAIDVFEWSQRQTPDAESYTLGVPLEVQIALCNKVKKHGWFNLPVTASEDYAINFARMIRDKLDPSLLAGCEYGNENWNFGLYGGYGWLATRPEFTNVTIPGAGDIGWKTGGYLSAKRLSVMAREFAYSRQFRPIWATQSVYPAVTEGNLAGFTEMQRQWADPTHANYNAEFATRFDEPGKLYTAGLMVTSYFNGAFRHGISTGDAATIRGWAKLSGDQGVLKLIQNFRDGSLLQDGDSGSLSGYLQSTSGNIAIADRLQMPWGCYEGQIELNYGTGPFANDDPDRAVIQDFLTRTYEHPAMKTLMFDALRLVRSYGCSINDILAEFGQRGGAYSTLSDAYGSTMTQRGQGMAQFRADPGPSRALTIAGVSESGKLAVGRAPKTKITTAGGMGLVKITVTGLPPGRTFDGFRGIVGEFSQAGTYTIIVTATDQAGSTATKTVQQVVEPPLSFVQTKYVKVKIEECAGTYRDWYPTLKNIWVVAKDSNVRQQITNWTLVAGQGQENKFPIANLNDDPSIDNAWASEHTGNFGPAVLIGSLPATIALETLVVQPSGKGEAPGKWQVWASDTPMSASSGGTKVLDLNEPATDNRWTDRTPRSFEVYLSNAAPVNSVAPTIGGQTEEGKTLSASTGKWSGMPVFTYQWSANGTAIDGATSATYVLTAAQVGTTMTVSVTASNAGGSATAISVATASVTATVQPVTYTAGKKSQIDTTSDATSPIGWVNWQASPSSLMTTGIDLTTISGAATGWHIASSGGTGDHAGGIWKTFTSGTNTYANSGVYPDTVIVSGWYASVTTNSTAMIITISGLDAAKYYDIEMFGSRYGTNDRGTIYAIGFENKNLVNDGNTNNVALFAKIPATNGKISIYCYAGNGSASASTYAYLNAMTIQEYTRT